MRHSHAYNALHIHSKLYIAVHEERGLAALAAGDPLRCTTRLAAILDHARDYMSWADQTRVHDKIATCYRAAGRPGKAILFRRYFQSTSDHTARLIDDYLAAGRFADAAAKMIDFAASYPEDPRARTMLAEAHRIHVGLDDDRSAAEVRARQREPAGPHAAAELEWFQVSHSTETQRPARLREFLADSPPSELRAVATAELGALLWRRACPLAGDPTLCGDLRSATLTVQPRDPQLTAEALLLLRRADRLAAGVRSTDRLAAARAMTDVHLADAELESSLRRGARTTHLARRYAAIARVSPSPRWTVAALARVALASADPAAARTCLAQARSLGRDDGSTHLCARLVGEPDHEFVGDAIYTESHPQHIDVQTTP